MRYLFGECALDTDRRELRRGADVVALEPQVFDLLVHVVRHRDRVVSKDELLGEIWHGRAVSESALFNRVNSARAAIGDTGEAQRFIKTLRGKGIRFVAAVHEERIANRQAAESSTLDGAPLRRPDLPLPDRLSIAVMPFANLDGDPDQEHLADGICEDLITGLARIRWL